MKIENWNQPAEEVNSVVATFDLAFGHLTIMGLMLCRHRQRAADGFVRIPKAQYTGARVCNFTHRGYSAILQMAVDMHASLTGERLRTGWNKSDAPTRPVISNWLDRHEADDAGLHRVLAA
ncbi:hypothetical protein AB3G45_26965 [Shinella sp. S4-D37]|uniref:hypothetical protein n=1 Tax=Shinella sp. S4-D37 TaxID=3161999 RepID=UPI003465E5F1